MRLNTSFGRRLLAGTALVVLGGTVAGSSLAQTALEEIVVTARKTSENLRDIPLQVTALSADLVLDVNMTTPRDLNSLSPGLNWQSQTGGRIGPGRLFFRGLAAGERADSKGSVFLDGGYLATSGWDIPFHYFERIEVMPGPQSAQFGRATFGGGINYITKDPTEDFEGTFNANVMTLGQREIDLHVAGPLMGDKVLGSIFASYQKYEGPSEWRQPPDVLHPTGVDIQGTSTLFGAGKLVFQPSDELRVETHLFHTYDHDDPVLVPFPNYEDLNGRFTKPNGQVVRYPVGSAFHIETSPGGFPTMTANWFNIPNPDRRQESWRWNNEVSYDIGDHNLSVQYYREYEWSKAGGEDSDYASFPGQRQMDRKIKTKGDSVEARLTSPQDSQFRYSVGAYYLKLNVDVDSTTVFDFVCQTVCYPTSPAAMFNPTANFNAATSSIAGYTGVVTRNTAAPVVTDQRNTTTNKSAFLALYYDFDDQWTLSFEGRYQSERIKTQNFIPNGFNAANTYKTFVPRVTVDYKYNDDGHVYALFSIGNQPGGFNTSPFIGQAGSGTTAADRIVPEEKLYNYEIGAKSLWFDGVVSTDLAIYHMDWKNQIQSVNFLQPGSTTTTYTILSGAGTSAVDGVGLSIAAAPADGLTINANISYNYARYKEFCSTALFALTGVATPGRLGCVDVGGNPTETVPPWINSVNVGYKHPLSGDWNWTVHGSFQYQDGQWESNMNLATSEAVYLFHFNVGVERENFSFELYCTNCTQEESPYRFTRLADFRNGPNINTNVSTTATPRRPRQIGAKASYSF